MKDIFDALYTVRVAFLRANLSPPDAIILATREDGIRLLSALKQENIIYRESWPPHGKPIEHPNASWAEHKLRWVEAILQPSSGSRW